MPIVKPTYDIPKPKIIMPKYKMPKSKMPKSKDKMIISKDKMIISKDKVPIFKHKNLIKKQKHEKQLYLKSHGIELHPVFKSELTYYDYYIYLYPQMKNFILGLYNNSMSCRAIKNKTNLLIYKIYHSIVQNPNTNCIHIKCSNGTKMKPIFKPSGLPGGCGNDTQIICEQHTDTSKQETNDIEQSIKDIENIVINDNFETELKNKFDKFYLLLYNTYLYKCINDNTNINQHREDFKNTLTNCMERIKTFINNNGENIKSYKNYTDDMDVHNYIIGTIMNSSILLLTYNPSEIKNIDDFNKCRNGDCMLNGLTLYNLFRLAANHNKIDRIIDRKDVNSDLISKIINNDKNRLDLSYLVFINKVDNIEFDNTNSIMCKFDGEGTFETKSTNQSQIWIKESNYDIGFGYNTNHNVLIFYNTSSEMYYILDLNLFIFIPVLSTINTKSHTIYNPNKVIVDFFLNEGNGNMCYGNNDQHRIYTNKKYNVKLTDNYLKFPANSCVRLNKDKTLSHAYTGQLNRDDIAYNNFNAFFDNFLYRKNIGSSFYYEYDAFLTTCLMNYYNNNIKYKTDNLRTNIMKIYNSLFKIYNDNYFLCSSGYISYNRPSEIFSGGGIIINSINKYLIIFMIFIIFIIILIVILIIKIIKTNKFKLKFL